MDSSVSLNRIVPNIYSLDLANSYHFYLNFLEMELAMDLGWIITFAIKNNPKAQISIIQFDQKDRLDNSATFLSIEVSDVDKLYEKAKQLQIEIIYPITDESWGVRRFFVKDPNGATINLLTHK